VKYFLVSDHLNFIGHIGPLTIISDLSPTDL